MQNLKARQQGFTLVELAIVLVIIGLLLGAVFKGQELIEQAKVRNTVNKINEVRAAVYTYLDKYDALPGDDGNPTPPVTTTAGGTANDGEIDDTTAWQQMFEAGLISGGGNPIKTPYGTDMAVLYGGAAINANTICAKVPVDVAQQIDRKYDDGAGDSGTILGAGNGNTPDTTAASVYNTTGNDWICTKL